MTEIGYLTCSNCQHDKEDTERAREAQGEGSYFCLLGAVSGGGGQESLQRCHENRVASRDSKPD